MASQKVHMDVYVESRQKALPVTFDAVSSLAEAVIGLEEWTCDEVGIHFVETQEMCDLHFQFFNDPSPTDCISFPIDKANCLGDVFVCPQTAIEYASKHRKDPYKELSLYVVHGLLHLMGYDDIEDEDRSAMRAAERRHMRHLKQQHLLLHE